jgi:hypothetical protein
MVLVFYLGAFHLMAWAVRPKYFSLYQWKDLVYVSQISGENGPHSNVIKIFRSDRSEAQMFCVSLMESALCYRNNLNFV